MNIAFNMDCMEAMRNMPDKCFDLAVVDPPYGIEINNNIGRRKGDKHSGHQKVKWDSCIPTHEYFEELKRVSHNQIIWGANYFYMPPTKCFIIWRKPQISEKLSFSMCEYAWASFDSTAKEVQIIGEINRIHPTQKPIALYDWIFSNCANLGDKILDTHLGSGSSRIAAHKAGLDFTGYELDKDYFEAQEERFNDYTAQMSLLTPTLPETYNQTAIRENTK